MKKAEREHLKHNEAADAVAATATFFILHARTLALGAVAMALGVAAVFGYRAYTARAEERAQVQLAQAMDVASAPVTPPAAAGVAAPAPPPAAGTYATEAARHTAAITQLLATADAFPKTDAALQARYYAAALLADSNRLDEAAAAYAAVRQQAGDSSLIGRMATLGHAVIQVRQRQFDPAITLLRDLSTRRDGHLPVDGVLMQLADAYQQAGQPAEAAQTLQRVIDEFPQGPYASDARQQADVLQAQGAKPGTGNREAS